MDTTDEARPPGLREQKKQATRVALSEATVALVLEHGWENVRVDDIAAAVGVSTRTFNNYYSSKEEAFIAPAEIRANRVLDGLRARPPDEPFWEALRQAFGTAFPAARRMDHDWVRQIRLIMSTPSLAAHQLATEARIARRLRTEVADRTGAAVTDLSVRLLSNLVMSTAQAAREHWYEADDPDQTLGSVLLEALGLLADGLAQPDESPRSRPSP